MEEEKLYWYQCEICGYEDHTEEEPENCFRCEHTDIIVEPPEGKNE